MTDYRLPLDERIFSALNQPPGHLLGQLGVLLGSRAVDLGVLALAAVFLVAKLRWRAVLPLLAIGTALASADLVGARILRPVFHRLRPCYALPAGRVHQLMPVAHSGSLPSLHAADSFAAATALWVFAPGAGPLAIAIASLIGISRVVVGVHWPSDVLAGALWGGAVGLGVGRGMASIARRGRAG